MIDFYTSPTPNGHKVSIALEEMNLAYKLIGVDLSKGDQKKEDYLKINPNGRIPTIVDRDNGDFSVFESGAILIYLGEKSQKFYPEDPKERSQVLQWLMFQMGGIGPMMGQANVFYRYFPETIQPAIDRYQNEVKRLFGVLDTQLERQEFLAKNYSIADMANWAWVRTHNWSGVEIEPFPNLERWVKQIYARPAAKKGTEIPPRPEANKIIESGKNMI
jgi:glutathione S-transferase